MIPLFCAVRSGKRRVLIWPVCNQEGGNRNNEQRWTKINKSHVYFNASFQTVC